MSLLWQIGDAASVGNPTTGGRFKDFLSSPKMPLLFSP
jgi:hypothetical protein